MLPVSKHNIQRNLIFIYMILKAIKLEESISDSLVRYTLISNFIKFNLLDILIILFRWSILTDK